MWGNAYVFWIIIWSLFNSNSKPKQQTPLRSLSNCILEHSRLYRLLSSLCDHSAVKEDRAVYVIRRPITSWGGGCCRTPHTFGTVWSFHDLKNMIQVCARCVRETHQKLLAFLRLKFPGDLPVFVLMWLYGLQIVSAQFFFYASMHYVVFEITLLPILNRARFYSHVWVCVVVRLVRWPCSLICI